MAEVKPFFCIRPVPAMAGKIAALPYDVYNRKEAKEVVEKNPDSFLKIDRAETCFPDDVDTYAPQVYQKAADLLREGRAKGSFIRDEKRKYYIYEMTMDGRVQTGIAAVVSIDDYLNNVIKKHENTRADKEQDRICHIDALNTQTGPIFLAYRANPVINGIVADSKQKAPLYDFVSEDGIRHRVFEIAGEADMETVCQAFSKMREIYIADGHHRAASAVKVGLKRRAEHPDYDGTEEFNYFLSVLFPDNELMIMDYNRVVKSLNGLTEEAFLDKMKELFLVEQIAGISGVTANLTETKNGQPHPPEDRIRPKEKGEFAMFFQDCWYHCSIYPKDVSSDPLQGLDVSLLQNLLLGPVLGIRDPKTDSRIDFVGGIRGLKELERRCHEDAVVAFAMYPTSIQELFAVADAGLLMPPKSTWFEPKLRSGLFLHEF